DYLLWSRSLIDASTRFLSILILLRLLDLTAPRDYLILYTLNLFLLLGAASSTTSPLFLLLLFLYALSVIWGMVIFTIMKEWGRRRPVGAEMPRDLLGLPFLIGTILLTLSSFMITMVIFFIMPRMGLGFLDSKTGNTVKLSGFSELVELGALGSIKKDRSVVMRIELPDLAAPPPSLYYRGITLDFFDGERWKQSLKERRGLKKIGDGFFPLASAQGSRMLKQNILLEPVETEVIFTAAIGIAVEGRFPEIRADSAGSFYRHTPSYSRIAYTAYSVPPGSIRRFNIFTGTASRDDTLHPSDAVYDASLMEKYLQLPKGMERVNALLAELVDVNDPPHRVATVIERHLKGNYRYTLTPRQREGIDPLEDFLFHSREGYCEQFATAMAILLRASGIPSRVVNGFLPGEWNGFGNYLLVRQSDAHSWVEAYLPERGWVIFDPTPPAGTVVASRTSPLLLYLDALRWRWHRYIVNYSMSDQIYFGRRVRLTTGTLLSRLKGSLHFTKSARFKSPWLYAAAPLIIILIVWMSLRTLKQRRIERSLKAPPFYLTMLDILEKRGLKREPSETPLEFARRCEVPAVLDITTIYLRVRYGRMAITPHLLREIREGLHLIQGGVN
ncbi:MAG: DUF3488 and DUF4129 domain-containing transglutaminase family protein, partial [Thermodesulfobacteriota bacterium]